jgi:Ankyrin repeats (3 copies)
MENQVIKGLDLSSRQKTCEKLKKRINIRSYTPDIKVCIRPEAKVLSPNQSKRESIKFNPKTRKLIAPIIGEVSLSREEFHLVTPKEWNPQVRKKEKFKSADLSPSKVALSFVEETKKMFKNQKNYMPSLRKSIKELKSLNIVNTDILEIDKVLCTKPYGYPNSRIFLRTCKHGLIIMVKKLIAENHFIVHSFDDIRMTGLHWCALRGHNEIISLLLSNGALVDSLDISHRTPLIIAVKKNNYQAVKILLINKADPFIVSNSKKSILDYAKNQLTVDTIKRAIECHKMINRLPEAKRDEKWKLEVIPSLLRLSTLKHD